MSEKNTDPKFGEGVERKNGQRGCIIKVCRMHAKWAHPRDHVEVLWSDGKRTAITLRGLARMKRW